MTILMICWLGLSALESSRPTVCSPKLRPLTEIHAHLLPDSYRLVGNWMQKLCAAGSSAGRGGGRPR